MDKTNVRRSYKDSLFRMIFRGKEELLSLYNAVNGSNYENPERLKVTTIEDVLYMGIKNDASFLIDDYLNLYEAQSTWNPNMPLRSFLYIASLYQGYIAENDLDIYSGRQIKLPTPKILIFYNGTEERAEVQRLRLSDSFIKREACGYALECMVTVLNINYGYNKKIMEGCRKLYEYAYLVEEIRKGIRTGLPLGEATDAAVEICIKENILAEFLRKHRAEVKKVILTEYNEELHIRTEKEISFVEGEKAGRIKGREEGIREGSKAERIKFIRNLLKQGMEAERICELAECSRAELDEIRDEKERAEKQKAEKQTAQAE